MRPLVLPVFLALAVASGTTISSYAAPGTHAYPSRAIRSWPCGQGFRCQDVQVQLCVKRPTGRNYWVLTRSDAQLRRGVSTRGCTEYATGISFTLRYNGRRAVVQQRSLACTVQAQRAVGVVIKKCYSVVQQISHHRFRDLVAGARVCVRSMGYRGPGCHDDFAINVVAYANGMLVGETFIGFRLRVPNL